MTKHLFTSLAFASIVLSSGACSTDDTQGTSADESGTDDSSGGSGTSSKKKKPGSSILTEGGTDDTASETTLAKNLAITEIAVFQGVKVDIVAKGKAVSARNAHLVANRPGLMRVYVTPTSAWDSHKVTATLTISVGKKVVSTLKDSASIVGPSTDKTLDSTFNFDFEAKDVPPGATFSVAINDADGEVISAGDSSKARYPNDGTSESLALTDLKGKLKVVIVPISYMADGSGRTSDVSTEQLELYRTKLMQLYPIEDADVTARAPVSWSQPIQYNGSGFDSILNSMIQLRQKDAVDDDVYYYATFQPTSSITSFCGRGCVAGLSSRVEKVSDSFLRASVGLGYPGEESAETMAHEIGHAHGRMHSPCGGAQGADPDYPNENGDIGSWGYDILNKTLIAPTSAKDIMGYCPPKWISDFTFEALFQRVVAVNNAKVVSSLSTPTTFRMVVEKDGHFSWGETMALRGAIGGTAKTVNVVSRSGASVPATAHFYPYDHLPGGFYLVPDNGIDVGSLQIDGKTLTRTP